MLFIMRRVFLYEYKVKNKDYCLKTFHLYEAIQKLL